MTRDSVWDLKKKWLQQKQFILKFAPIFFEETNLEWEYLDDKEISFFFFPHKKKLNPWQ